MKSKFKATIWFKSREFHAAGTLDIEAMDFRSALTILGDSVQTFMDEQMELPNGLGPFQGIQIHLRKDRMFTCSVCGKRFKSVERALLHKSRAH